MIGQNHTLNKPQKNLKERIQNTFCYEESEVLDKMQFKNDLIMFP